MPETASNIDTYGDALTVEANILPSVINALTLGDSCTANIFSYAAYDTYSKINFRKFTHLSFDLFLKSYKGYLLLQAEGVLSNSRYLTIINFELPSTVRRLWVIDLLNSKVVINDLVSHGRNTGENYAESFSNTPESFKSSLGFYVTGMPYIGKNDYSLRLLGLEDGFNDNALERGIVMHGADYVSHSYIRQNHRLGRSQGCPAVPQKIHKYLINLIQGGSCLFIYYPEKHYLAKSNFINAPEPSKEFFQNSDYALNLP